MWVLRDDLRSRSSAMQLMGATAEPALCAYLIKRGPGGNSGQERLTNQETQDTSRTLRSSLTLRMSIENPTKVVPESEPPVVLKDASMIEPSADVKRRSIAGDDQHTMPNRDPIHGTQGGHEKSPQVLPIESEALINASPQAGVATEGEQAGVDAPGLLVDHDRLSPHGRPKLPPLIAPIGATGGDDIRK